MPVAATFAAFGNAVRAGQPDPLEIGFEHEAEAMARRSLTEAGLLLLGECHGVAENAAVITTLVDRLQVNTVALEWPVALGPVLARFLTRGELTDDQLWWLGDGRISVQNLIAAKALADTGIAVVLIDAGSPLPPGSWSERERALADAALAVAVESARVLLVAGNAHTPVTGTDFGTPMGAWIARRRPGVKEIAIEYGSGSYFNFTFRRFPDRFGEEPAARLCASHGHLRLRLPRAHAATVPVAATPGCRLLG